MAETSVTEGRDRIIERRNRADSDDAEQETELPFERFLERARTLEAIAEDERGRHGRPR